MKKLLLLAILVGMMLCMSGCCYNYDCRPAYYTTPVYYYVPTTYYYAW